MPNASHLLEKATRLHQGSELEEALVAYTEIVRTYPGTPEAWSAVERIRALGSVRSLNGVVAELLEDLSESSTDGFHDASSLLEEATRLHQGSELEEALVTYTEIVRSFPGTAEATSALGRIRALGSVPRLNGLVAELLEDIDHQKPQAPTGRGGEPQETRTCPYCAEEVKAAAVLCKHCGMEIERKGQSPKDTRTYQGTPPPAPPAMKSAFICPQCGSQGTPVTVTPGSILIELVLWLAFLIPGLVYSLWRLSARTRNTCPQCHTPGMIPSDTPVAKEIQRHFRGAGPNDNR